MITTSDTVSVSRFVKRQLKGSGKTYADGLTFEEIASHAEKQLNAEYYTEGYRKGVILVQVSKELIYHFAASWQEIENLRHQLN